MFNSLFKGQGDKGKDKKGKAEKAKAPEKKTEPGAKAPASQPTASDAGKQAPGAPAKAAAKKPAPAPAPSAEMPMDLDEMLSNILKIEDILGHTDESKKTDEEQQDRFYSIYLRVQDMVKIMPTAFTETEDLTSVSDTCEVVVEDLFDQLSRGKVETTLDHFLASVPKHYLATDVDRAGKQPVMLPLPLVVEAIGPEELQKRTAKVKDEPSTIDLPDLFGLKSISPQQAAAPATQKPEKPAAPKPPPTPAAKKPAPPKPPQPPAAEKPEAPKPPPPKPEAPKPPPPKPEAPKPPPATTKEEEKAAAKPATPEPSKLRLKKSGTAIPVSRPETAAKPVEAAKAKQPKKPEKPTGQAPAETPERIPFPHKEEAAAKPQPEKKKPVPPAPAEKKTEKEPVEKAAAAKIKPEAPKEKAAPTAPPTPEKPKKPVPKEADQQEPQVPPTPVSEPEPKAPAPAETAKEPAAKEPVKEPEKAPAPPPAEEPPVPEKTEEPTETETPAKPEAGKARGARPRLELHGIDINTANPRELIDRLPGMTHYLAARLIEEREFNGSFFEAADLARIPGMNDTHFEAMTDQPWRQEIYTQMRTAHKVIGPAENGPPDLPAVATRFKMLEGFEGCLITHQDGDLLASSWSDRPSETLKAMAPQIIKRVRQYMQEIDIGETLSVTVNLEGRSISVVQEQDICFAAVHGLDGLSRRHIQIVNAVGWMLGARFTGAGGK
jgi:predicted regulator of Ras-like GTPase activity (Roadblock/LC7/MglB family)